MEPARVQKKKDSVQQKAQQTEMLLGTRRLESNKADFGDRVKRLYVPVLKCVVLSLSSWRGYHPSLRAGSRGSVIVAVAVAAGSRQERRRGGGGEGTKNGDQDTSPGSFRQCQPIEI